MTHHERKKRIFDLAEKSGMVAASVRCGSGHVFFIRKNGRLVSDWAFSFDEALDYLTTRQNEPEA